MAHVPSTGCWADCANGYEHGNRRLADLLDCVLGDDGDTVGLVPINEAPDVDVDGLIARLRAGKVVGGIGVADDAVDALELINESTVMVESARFAEWVDGDLIVRESREEDY